MKLSKSQSNAIFNLIKDELNSNGTKIQKENKAYNKKVVLELVKEFKTTDEYKALKLLNINLPESLYFKEFNFSTISILAVNMFKPKLKPEYISSYTERDAIELLAIDCKTLKELKVKIVNHYGLKKSI